MTSKKVNYDTVTSAIEKRIDWHMYNSFDRGIPVASAEQNRPCPECNGLTAYQVFSYSTLIYSECSHCGRIKANGYRYSHTTRKLQSILARILPAMEKALDKAYAYEKEWARIASNERARDRRIVANGHGTLTSRKNSVKLSFPDSDDLVACLHLAWNESIAAQYESTH